MSHEDYPLLCTFAATGREATFQEIYICTTCSERNICRENDHEGGEAMPLCICNNCAEQCHEDFGHEVEYYGRGPCYCDCSSFHNDKGEDGCSCILQAASTEAALKLGINTERISKIGDNESDNNGLENNHHLLEESKSEQLGFPFLFDVLTIPSLLPNESISPCDRLIDQAIELIKHSTDTHWIPHGKENCDKLCQFEKLAYSIFQRHVDTYRLSDKIGPDGGIEWWVQVKNMSKGDSKEAPIDLHYDKDEELAEKFDIGSFPTLSTVTYLGGGIIDDGVGRNKVCAAPTLIFPHTYDMPDEGIIGGEDSAFSSGPSTKSSPPTPNVVISHVRTGKHIVFDGRLLHGAPGNPHLRQNPEVIRDGEDTKTSHEGIRVTFLVNIWLARRPSKVTILPSGVRDKLRAVVQIDPSAICHDESTTTPRALEMMQRNVGTLDIRELTKGSDSRINIPFVSTGATWIDDDSFSEDREETGLVVSMIPPQQHEDDTVFLNYHDEESAPILKYVGGDGSD